MCLYTVDNNGDETKAIYIAEMQKVADAADISVLFFFQMVLIFGPFWQFWVIFGLFWVILGHFWVLIFCGKILLCAI